MPEVSYPAKREFIVYEVVFICDSCEEGHMWTDNTMLTVDPPLYPHTCNKCGHQANYDKVYPGIEYGS